MPKYTDRPDIKAGLQIFKYSEEMDPGFYICLAKAKASAIKKNHKKILNSCLND